MGKAFMLGTLSGVLMCAFVWVSNEAYHEDIRAKANIERHQSMNWYGVRPDQIKQ